MLRFMTGLGLASILAGVFTRQQTKIINYYLESMKWFMKGSCVDYVLIGWRVRTLTCWNY
jgi:hypothetical protein